MNSANQDNFIQDLFDLVVPQPPCYRVRHLGSCICSLKKCLRHIYLFFLKSVKQIAHDRHVTVWSFVRKSGNIISNKNSFPTKHYSGVRPN